jgi:hypothetical protein
MVLCITINNDFQISATRVVVLPLGPPFQGRANYEPPPRPPAGGVTVKPASSAQARLLNSMYSGEDVSQPCQTIEKSMERQLIAQTDGLAASLAVLSVYNCRVAWRFLLFDRADNGGH